MNIGFDAKRAFTNNTGLGNYSRYTINSLCRLYPEHSYTLYTPSAGSNNIYEPPENSQTTYPDSARTKKLKSYWRTFGITNQLVRDNIQLYHGLSNELPVGIGKRGIKSVVTIHDLIFLRLPTLYNAIDRRIYLAKTRNAVRYADRIVAISAQTRDDLVELLKADREKIRVIYQGCNPWFQVRAGKEQIEKIRNKYALPKNYLLYVGTIEERKNLLEIVKAIHQNKIDVPLVVVGKKSSYFNKVQKYIAEYQVRNLHFHHHIENRDLPGVYQLADAFIYPSSYEGFGIPVLEALNSGTPVITSAGGCLEETAGGGGLFVTPGNTDQLGEAIKSVLYNSELRQKLREAGAEHALQFREEQTIPKLVDLYKECLP